MPPTFVKHTFTTISSGVPAEHGSGVGGSSARSAKEVLPEARRSRVTWATSPRPAPRRLRAVVRTLAGSRPSRGLRGWPVLRRRSKELEEGKLCSRAELGGARERRCFRPGGGPELGFPAAAAAAAPAPWSGRGGLLGLCSPPFSGRARVH